MSNKRKRPTKNFRPSSSDLMVFGYASKIYNDNNTAQKTDNDEFLIPWQSNADYNHLKFDRYDVRHLLDQIDDFNTNQTTTTHNLDWRDPTDLECDPERYADLDSDEELLFDMSDAEDKEAYVADKRRRRSQLATGKMYHYDYDSNASPSPPLTIADRSTEIQQIAQQFDIPATDTMQIPTNSRGSNGNEDDMVLDVIVETAQAIVERTQTGNQPVNVCEIQFQVRHSQDRQYDFLNKQHIYYPFYQHVRKYIESKQCIPTSSSASTQHTGLIKKTNTKGLGALVDYGSDSDSDSGSNSNDDDNTQQQNRNQSADEMPNDIKETINKMAASVTKVGRDLENKVRQLRSQDPRFAFLQPHHPYHSYYQRQLGLQSKQRLP